MNYSVFALDGDINMAYVRKYIVDNYDTENIPEEWLLLTCFYKWEIQKNRDLTNVFVAFVKKFYPDFTWFEDTLDYSMMVSRECFFVNGYFLKMFAYGMSGDIVLDDGTVLEQSPREKRLMARASEFGAIVKDFLVRYVGYVSVNHDDKTILSVNDESDGRIQELLNKGYTLYRFPRLIYKRDESSPYLGRQFSESDENLDVLEKSNFSL